MLLASKSGLSIVNIKKYGKWTNLILKMVTRVI